MKRCIRFFNDVSQDEKDLILKTKEDDDPVLVIFRKKNVFYSSNIIGDDTIIYTETNNMAHSLLLYCGVYKVLELEIPKVYAPVLGMLNSIIFGDPWNSKHGKQTPAYLNVKEKVEKEMKRGTICSGQGKQN